MDRDGRRRIESAALELFAGGGVEATSTRDIARRAGVAEGTLYRHFRTKEELAARLFADAASRLVSRLERDIAAAVTPEERIYALVASFFAFAGEDPVTYDFIVESHPRLGRLPDTRLPKDVIVELLVHGAAEGAFGPLDPVLGAAVLVGMITKAIFFLKHDLLHEPPDVVRAQVAHAALLVLKGTP